MRRIVVFAVSLLGASSVLAADAYPDRPIRVIVPFAAGGTTDLSARWISEQLGVQLDKPLVVENRTGAGGTIANAFVAKAAPDGYTLMMADPSLTIVPSLYKSLPFDVARDFTPISQVMRAPNVVVVTPGFKAATLKELLTYALANPGKLNYGSGGIGSASHLAAVIFNTAAKVDATHIPFKGAGEAYAAGIGGQVELLVVAMPGTLAHVRSGKLRALAVTTDGKRSAALPDVPSASEAGVPGAEVYNWNGLVGPAGLPKDVVNKLHAEVVKAIAVPAVRERYAAQGAEVVGSTPEQFSELIRGELRRYAAVVKAAGIQPE